MIKDYLAFFFLPALLALAIVYAVQEGVFALAWALALALLGLAFIGLVIIAADLALALLSLLALALWKLTFGAWKLTRAGTRWAFSMRP